MDESGFQKYLKQYGKQEHVIDGLIWQIRQFEEYLAQGRHKVLADADAVDLQEYMVALKSSDPRGAGKKVRGLGLYYQFTGNSDMAALAGAMREQEVAKTRRVFALEDFSGVNQEYIRKLRECGIVNVEHMLEVGNTPPARQKLADATRIPVDAILELVKLSDLTRLGALKSIRARLYYEAGADTPDKIAGWAPEALRAMLVDFVARSGFPGIAPLPKEVRNAVARAREIPKLVEYE